MGNPSQKYLLNENGGKKSRNYMDQRDSAKYDENAQNIHDLISVNM